MYYINLRTNKWVVNGDFLIPFGLAVDPLRTYFLRRTVQHRTDAKMLSHSDVEREYGEQTRQTAIIIIEIA